MYGLLGTFIQTRDGASTWYLFQNHPRLSGDRQQQCPQRRFLIRCCHSSRSCRRCFLDTVLPLLLRWLGHRLRRWLSDLQQAGKNRKIITGKHYTMYPSRITLLLHHGGPLRSYSDYRCDRDIWDLTYPCLVSILSSIKPNNKIKIKQQQTHAETP